MFLIQGAASRMCEGWNRRDYLRIGVSGALGMLSNNLLADVPSFQPKQPNKHGAGSAKSCILIYLFGGPSHLDIWDMKPSAPAEIRGEFKPIATNVSGIQITEHLPRLAKLADKYAIV